MMNGKMQTITGTKNTDIDELISNLEESQKKLLKMADIYFEDSSWNNITISLENVTKALSSLYKIKRGQIT